MNKTELVAAVAEQGEVSKKDAEKVLKAFVDVVTEELKKVKKEIKMCDEVVDNTEKANITQTAQVKDNKNNLNTISYKENKQQTDNKKAQATQDVKSAPVKQEQKNIEKKSPSPAPVVKKYSILFEKLETLLHLSNKSLLSN